MLHSVLLQESQAFYNGFTDPVWVWVGVAAGIGLPVANGQKTTFGTSAILSAAQARRHRE
jgi:hypothetical protein